MTAGGEKVKAAGLTEGYIILVWNTNLLARLDGPGPT
jgi:hypothetical protein